MLAAVDISPVQSFVTALVERDFSGLERALAQDVRFRALAPPGFRERETSAAARELIQSWFEDADIFDVEFSSIEAVGECVHAGYRVRVREDWSVVCMRAACLRPHIRRSHRHARSAVFRIPANAGDYRRD